MSDTPREQAEAKAAAITAALSDEDLREAWIITEFAAGGSGMTIMRGWLMNELERRMGTELFNQWLSAVDDVICSTPDPGDYLAKRA